MNTYLIIFLIAISLSMDAFSLALIYGTQDINDNEKKEISIIVGIYHFIMPILGRIIGKLILSIIPFKISIIVGIIFLLIAIEMIYSSIKKDIEPLSLTLFSFLLFGLSVSIDSFTTGIGLKIITNNWIQPSIIFSIVSASLTYIGLIIGNKINNKIGNISTIIGGIILIILSIYYIIK